MVNFRGFFLQKKDKASSNDGANTEPDSDSDGDDYENPDYQDIMQIASGKYQSLNTTKTRCVAEKLQEIDYEDGRFVLKGEKIIRARFDSAFSHPWWMVEVFEINTITRSRTQRKEMICSYSIRCDDGVDKSLLSLFLTQGCGVNVQHASSFLEFIETRNLIPTFVHLLGNLQEFASSGEVNSEIAKQIRTSLAFSATGKAFLVPELTKVAHRLLPRHATTLFSSNQLDVLQDIEKALKSEPWILGFQHILQERFGIGGCEVKIPSFANCNLMEKMPVVKRDALYIYNALCKVTYKYGHTYVPLQQLKGNKYFQPPFTPQVYRVSTWDDSLNYLKEIDVVKTSGDSYGKPSSVFLPQIRRYEQTIVRSICRIMKKSHPWLSGLELDEQVFGGDADQSGAAKMVTASPVVVLSGKGGCGKTHVVSTVLSKALKLKRTQFAAASKSFDKQDEPPVADSSQSLSDASQTLSQGCLCSSPSFSNSFAPGSPLKEENSCQNAPLPSCQTERTDPCGAAVLLTAPTGRAASILGKRTGLDSFTLHSVIFSYFRWLKESKNGERHSEWKFSQVKLLVCDESSLVSVKTFSTLINILMRNSPLQQIILLGDINQLPSIEPGNFLSDVYHALMPHGSSVTLRTNHRAESQLIVENASRISCQKMPFFPDDPKRGFISLCYQLKQSDDGTEPDDMAITQVVRDLLENKISTVTLPEPEKSQFIAFRRRDCLNINELCARHYNKHSIKDAKGKLDFQVGDKVCVKKNIVCFDVFAEEEVKLCNGEIFFINEVFEEEDNRNKKTTHFALDNGEKIMKIDFKMLKKAKLCHAWARTIHTYQGSEIDTVVYVVGSPIYQTCQHVYTAVTRGVRQVIVINNPKNLEAAVKTKPFLRKTKLKRFLTSDLQKPVSDEEGETQEFAPSSSDVDETREVLGSIDNNEFCKQNLDHSHYFSGFQTASELFAGSSAADSPSFSHGLENADSSSCAETSEAWQDVFKEEDDEEMLAWALDVESNVNTSATPTERTHRDKPDKKGVGDTNVAEDFHVSRRNLNIKKEKQNRAECLVDETSQSAVHGVVSNHGYVTSSDFNSESNSVMVKSVKPDAGAAHLGDDLYSLNDLTCGAIIPFSPSVFQGSPSPDRVGVVGCHSPNMPSGCSVLFTPPQTPTGVKLTCPSLTKGLLDSAPRKRNTPGSSASRKSGGTIAKSRRRSFTAKYDGLCDVCKGPIRRLVDEITHLQSGATKSWVHQKCIKSK